MKKFLTIAFLFSSLLTLCACSDGSAADADGALDGPPPLHEEHVFGDWQITLPSSCAEAGISARICTVCQYMETSRQDPVGHSFGEWTVTLAPTCLESGTRTRTCSVCQGFDTQTVQATGHRFGEWTVTLSPLCEVAGTESQTCSDCAASVAKAIEPSGHLWEESWTQTLAPSCDKKGMMTLYCQNCDKTQVRDVKPSGHSYSVTESKRATLTEDGYEIQTCGSCHDVARTVFHATGSLGVQFTDRSDGTCIVTEIGSFTGETLILPSHHNGNRVVAIADDAFSGCAFLKSVVLSDTILTVGKNAFEECTALQSVDLGAGLTKIEDSAFFSCTALTTLRGGSALSAIEKFAFWGCSELSSLTLGKSLATVGELAFYGCSALAEIFYEGETVTDWLAIAISADNTPFITAERFYFSDTQPSAQGNFWRLVDGIPTKW